MKQKRLIPTLLLSVTLLGACGLTEKLSPEEPATPAEQEKERTETANNEQETPNFLYEIDQKTWQVTPLEGEDAPAEAVLLTFDDAPDQHAVEIAEKLQRASTPAIFFVNGMYLDEPGGAEKLKEIHDLGFEIGNHTYTHPDLTTLSYDEQKDEIVAVNDRVEDIIGVRPRFIRPPFGLFNEHTRTVSHDEGMTIMNWTYGYDWEEEYQDSAALADIMVNTEYLAPGANLLMHDRPWTMEAITDIATGIKDKGYTFVDPSELISAGDLNDEN